MSLFLIGSLQFFTPAQPLTPDEHQEDTSAPIPDQASLEQPGEILQRNDTPSITYFALLLAGLLGLGALRSYQQIKRSNRRCQQNLVRQQAERRELLQRIATLDATYTQEMADEETYRTERDRLKQQIIDLTIQGKNIKAGVS